VFETGDVVVWREVWDGRPWLSMPATVVGDDGTVLAVRIGDGTPFTFDDAEPAHPWSGRAAWSGATVLQLRRAGSWYSVWKFFDGDVFAGWYVNFERPVVRRPDGIDTDDLELDLVVEPDGTRRWKDVEHLHARLEEGRFSVDDLVRVLEAAAEVSDRLDRDDRWWAPWDDWVPTAPPR
jgi:hypothetical protein